MKFPATFIGDKRQTPLPEELRALDAIITKFARETRTDMYQAARHLLWHANKASTSGYSRLPPIEEVREAKVRPDALGAEIETHLEGA